MEEATRRCPGLQVRPMRTERYRQVGAAIHELLRRYLRVHAHLCTCTRSRPATMIHAVMVLPCLLVHTSCLRLLPLVVHSMRSGESKARSVH
jgi:hypothetical protein